jgi:hypothetical protein
MDYIVRSATHRHLYSPDDMILNETSQWRAIGRHNVLLVGIGDVLGLGPSQLILGKVTIHFITVKVGVVGITIGVVHPNGLLRWIVQDAHSVGHDTGLVQCRLSTEEKWSSNEW